MLSAAVAMNVAAQSTATNAAAPTLIHRYSFTADASDSVGHADGVLQGEAAISDGQVHLSGKRGTYVSLPGDSSTIVIRSRLNSGRRSGTIELGAGF